MIIQLVFFSPFSISIRIILHLFNIVVGHAMYDALALVAAELKVADKQQLQAVSKVGCADPFGRLKRVYRGAQLPFGLMCKLKRLPSFSPP